MINLRNLSRKTIGIAIASIVGLSLCLCILIPILDRPSTSKSSLLIDKVKLLSKFKSPKWTEYKSFAIEDAFIGDVGQALYICRANHGFEAFYQDIELIPGVYDPHRNVCSIYYGQSDYHYTKFEVLTVEDHSSLIWVQSSNGEIPVGSIIAGKSITDDEVPIVKLNHKGATWIGAVQVRHGIAYVNFDGQTVGQPFYHILCLRDISL